MLPPTNSSLVAARRRTLASATTLNLRAAALLPATCASTHARSLWNWRHNADWSSHLDPTFHRVTRIRTLKTRAKILDRLRRRSRFLWDSNADRPFFTPKHIRFASHFNSRGPRWGQEDGKKKRKIGEEGEGEDGYELSPREREWKERMEFMRKRIESDPYEAIFGKRLEPFWSPLVPSWMREEMGLQGWPKEKKEGDEKAAKTAGQNSKAEMKAEVKAVERKAEAPQQSYSSYSSTSWDSWSNKTRRTEWDSTSGQVKRFEYDPVSNRMVEIEAPKTESNTINTPKTDVVLSSTSALNKVSNDMRSLINSPANAVDIPVRKSFAIETKKVGTAERAQPVGFAPPASEPQTPGSSESATFAREAGEQQAALAAALDNPKLEALPGTLKYEQQHAAEAKEAQLAQTRSYTHPALAKLPKNDEDMITADEVRARMGKLKDYPPPLRTATPEEKAAMESRFKDSSAEWDKAESAVFLEHELSDLNKKKAKLMNEEKSAFHVERVQREVAKVHARIEDVRQKLAAAGHEPAQQCETASRLRGRVGNEQQRVEVRLPTSLDRTSSAPKTQVEKPMPLQPTLERLQTKESIKAAIDPDDSAAHELTEPLDNTPPASTVPSQWDEAADLLQADRVRRTAGRAGQLLGTQHWPDASAKPPASIEVPTPPSEPPYPGAGAESLIQANARLSTEVKEHKFRLAAHENRYAAKIKSLRSELETAYTQSSVHSSKHVERIRFLEEDASAKEKKYAEKIKSLREELERAYRQSAIHGAKHVERIQWLEGELAKKASTNSVETQQKFVEKIRALREELDRAYKQSAVHGEKHAEALHDLRAVLARVKKAGGEPEKVVDPAATQAEGDFSPTITKFAKDSEKWYKRPSAAAASSPAAVIDASAPAQKSTTSAAAKGEVERQPIYQAEEDVDLGEALAEYERKQAAAERPKVRDLTSLHRLRNSEAQQPAQQNQRSQKRTVAPAEPRGPVFQRNVDPGLDEALKGYEEKRTRKESLETEIQATEREAHEKQAEVMIPETPVEMQGVVARELAAEEAEGDRAKTTAGAQKTVDVDVRWEEPAVYKVLAYDSGNDTFSTATTTSNWTGSETPISIPQALSQLYQPARFVSHFAELQKDGWQVLYGTRDLLVFRKAKTTTVAEPAAATAVAEPEATLEDHGLIKPNEKNVSEVPADSCEDLGPDHPDSSKHRALLSPEEAMAQEAAAAYDMYKPKSAAKPYDPTSIENGTLMPKENLMAQEAANAYDARRTAVNPIDGTTRTASSPAAGDFASPTGFVSYDRQGYLADGEEATREKKNEVQEAMNKKTSIADEADVDYRHYPRVRRQERVFSGTKSKRWNERQERHRRRWEEREERQRSRRGLWRWAVGVGAGTAVLIYTVGVVAEMGRQERNEKERWQEVLEGRKGRWE